MTDEDRFSPWIYYLYMDGMNVTSETALMGDNKLIIGANNDPA